MQAVITIKGSKLYEPIVLDGIQWETARKGEPGKLTFTVVKDAVIAFQEGNEVTLTVDGKMLFFGYVFQKSRNKEQQIKVVAYDQLRYLKNKFIYLYTDTAAGLIKRIAEDFILRVGTLADTKYVIPSRLEDNTTLFDMIQTALDITFDNTQQLYVLHDDAGKLTLKNIADMQLKTVIDEETAADFDYTSSIDGETYNCIRLYYEDGQDKKTRVLCKPAIDEQHVAEWGLLQLLKKVDNTVNAGEMAKTLLNAYNRKTRTLKVKGALGDVNVRAGCMLPVVLNLGDIVNKSYLLCERVVHHFEQGHHSMDITFSGGGSFVGS